MVVSVELRARAELELRRRRAQILTQAQNNAIPDEMTFRQWCEQLAAEGMKVDGKPFRLDNRPALVPIYDAIPTTKEEAKGKTLVIQKATQLGLTVWEVLANTYLAKKFGPCNIGMFLPDQATAAFKSEHRFMRIVRSVPQILKELTHREDETGTVKRVGEGNVLTRVIAESILMFLWTSGKVSTESRPMDIVTLDEVQEMTLDQIDKVRARTGDSDIQFTLLLSTANLPDMDINYWYRQGTQEVWHTECPHCGALSDLSDPAGIFPDKSIKYDSDQREYAWACPECKGTITDPQQGRYIAQNPGASNSNVKSFLLPRTISPKMTPRDIVEAWGRAKTGDQKKSFYNRTLARPYIDADQLPVTMMHCLAAVEEGKRLAIAWKQSARDTFMGIDQMGGFNAVIIKERLPDGRQAVIHVEAVFDLDPFERCGELMKQFGVAVCVVEQLPNVNDARRFANRFPGRVFLAGYSDLKDDSMVWGDDLSKSDRRTSEDERTRYTVTLNQYKCMQTSLFRVKNKHCLFPDPDELEQDVIEDGITKRIPIVRDWVFVHFTKTALVVEQNEEERKPRAKVMKIGIDPHYSYANMLCDVAWARSYGNSTFILPQGGKELTVKQKGVQEAMPGLPEDVVRMIEEKPEGEVCGKCISFNAEKSLCEERCVKVSARDVGCALFVEIEG
nr:phage terminase large subunit family protein [Nitrosomonas nitrosa]